MARYISNKNINPSKVNKLEDFYGIGDSIWNFVSSVYQANWDSLYTDNQTTTLRAKILFKFTPRIILNPGKSNKEIAKPIPVTIEKIPLSPSLPAKLKREVNVILKYFQSNKPSAEPTKPTMSYAQALKQNKLQTLLKYLKSRKCSLPSMQRKLTRLTTSSKAIQNQNLTFK